MDPLRDILRAHRRALDDYLDITRCNAAAGEDNLHSRAAATEATEMQFLLVVKRILEELECEP